MESTAKKLQAVYAIVPKSDGKDLFLRVGSGFPNRDGSMTILLDAVPIGGKLHVRDYLPREQQAARGEHHASAQHHAELELV